jgi:plastocyanin
MPFPPLIRAVPAACLTACALALTALGCGDQKTVEVEASTLRLRLDEYRIMPQDVRVSAGRLRIVATNVGRLTHNVKIVREDEDNLEAPVQEVGGTRSTQPGESAAVTFADLPPGEYRLACTIANHDDLGQYGTLIVTEQEE